MYSIIYGGAENKNGNNKNYFHFIDSHTVVKNHSNLMASVRVFRDEPSFFTSDDANIQHRILIVNIINEFIVYEKLLW